MNSQATPKEGLETTQQSIHHYLIAQSRKGDRRAQNELYKLYAGAMYQICRRMMGNEETARDMLQEAFTDAFLNLDKLREDFTFSAWLKRIVVNHCLNELKRKKLLTKELGENYDYSEENSDSAYEHIAFEAKKILKALDQISDGCKTIFNLYLFEGYDHKEIAEILQITESTSKAQLSKAKLKIKQILKEL